MHLLSLYAEYNRTFNRQLAAVLVREFAELTEPLLAQLNHIFVMDLVWVERLGGPPDRRTRLGMDAALFAGLPEWRAAREPLDATIAALAQRVVDAVDRGDTTISFETKADRQVVVARRDQAMLHLFNHQSLHRGEILCLLSQAGIRFGTADMLPLVVEARSAPSP